MALYTINQLAEMSGRSIQTIRSRQYVLKIRPVRKEGMTLYFTEEDAKAMLSYTGNGKREQRGEIDRSVPEGWGHTCTEICNELGISKVEFARRKKMTGIKGVYAARGKVPMYLFSDEEKQALIDARKVAAKRSSKKKVVWLNAKQKVLNDTDEITAALAKTHQANLWKLSVQYADGYFVKAVCLSPAQACQIKRTLEICGIESRISPHLEHRKAVPYAVEGLHEWE